MGRVYMAQSNVRVRKSMGKYVTVFQAEVPALTECSCMNIEKGYRRGAIYMKTDSRAAQMALASHRYILGIAMRL